MHFSKTYSQLLLTLPDELRNSAIEYRQLKKLINELVAELESLGLSPLVLHELLQKDAGDKLRPFPQSSSSDRGRGKGKERALGERPLTLQLDSQSLLSVSLPASLRHGRGSSPAIVVYELTDEAESGDIIPRLRLWVEKSGQPEQSSSFSAKGIIEDVDDSDENASSLFPSPNDSQTALSIDTEGGSDSPPVEAASRIKQEYMQDDVVVLSSPVTPRPRHDLLWTLQERSGIQRSNSWNPVTDAHVANENDAANPVTFSDNNHEVVIPLTSDMAFFRLLTNALHSLSVALNASRDDLTSSIETLSTIIARTSRPASARGKSDLYTWRAIFQLYMEAQVFESTSERDRGERSIEDSEARLAQFARRVGEGGFSLRMAASRDGLERFLELNVRLLNLKKFQNANAEAARKILKKHAKRTALPLPSSALELMPVLELGQTSASIPHILVVALTETLMPVVPHIDDYLCLICLAIAFKPIRLGCGHLFCVRCLVKMQKQGKDNCPLCRAPTVITANKSNVDHALINFMLDWFPKETKEKAKVNEHESAKEEMEELGLDTRCMIM